jgi:nicotinamide riboside kinase
MIRIGMTGVPGAGKTSTARALAGRCRKIQHLKSLELISEYARRYISKFGLLTSVWEQLMIFEGQLDWEDSVPESKTDILITDSPLPLSLMYAYEIGAKDNKEINALNKLVEKMNYLNMPTPRYDIIFHIPPILPLVDDGVRSQIQFSQEWRDEANCKIMSFFSVWKPKRFVVLDNPDTSTWIDICLNEMNKIMLPQAASTIEKLYDDLEIEDGNQVNQKKVF